MHTISFYKIHPSFFPPTPPRCNTAHSSFVYLFISFPPFFFLLSFHSPLILTPNAQILMDIGPPMREVNLPEVIPLKTADSPSPSSHQLSVASQWGVGLKSHSSMHANWLDLVPILYRQPQLLGVLESSTPVMSRRQFQSGLPWPQALTVFPLPLPWWSLSHAGWRCEIGILFVAEYHTDTYCRH